MTDTRKIPDADIPWIIRLIEQDGCSLAYIADEWNCSQAYTRRRLEAAGYHYRRRGVPAGLPTISLQAALTEPGTISAPHVVPYRNKQHLVVMSLEQYQQMEQRADG